MSLYEVAAENGHRVRVEADSEAEAVAIAHEVDPDIEMAGAYLIGDLVPVGWDGGDPHDAVAEGESIDHGDYK